MTGPERNESGVYWWLLAASCAHVVEEYLWPGGFLEVAKDVAPRAFEHASIPIVVGVNAAMVAGCLGGAMLARREPFLGLSMASLLHANALLHLAASMKARRYVPGLVTGLALYLPLSLKAFSSYRRSKGYRPAKAMGAALLGLAWHSVPFIAFALRSRWGRGEGKA
ncbi:MAG: HXXEE domain-containing protein [Candidatus Geothermincolales bacterium]